MSELQFLSPAAIPRVTERPLADRLDRLDGARVAVFDNQKANAGALLAAIGERLEQRFGVELATERKIASAPAPDDVMARLRSVDAVVLAIAD